MSAPASRPKPRQRRLARAALVLLMLLFLAAVVPGSPLHLSNWLAPAPREDGRTVAQLTADLSSPDPEARRSAAAALGRLNEHAAPAVPRLAEAMRQDGDPLVRAAAADALRKIGPASAAAVRDLAESLKDSEAGVRMSAALALGRLKGEARPAVPELIAAAGDEENDTNFGLYTVTVRQAALSALGTAAAGTGDAVPTFTAVIENPAPDHSRALAARGLGLAGESAKPAAPQLRALLRDRNADVRVAAEEALAALGLPRDGPAAVGPFDGLQLPADERKRLWEIEHRVNVLNKYGFEPLAAALRRADAAALERLLAPGFAGSEPDGADAVAARGYASVERVRAGAKGARPLTRERFVNRLIELRRACDAGASVKLVVATLKPKDLAAPEGVWEGTALLRVHGQSPAGPAEVTATLAFEVAAPAEGSLAAGWLRAGHLRQVAVARSPAYLFAERAKARGLNVALHDNWEVGALAPSSGGVYVTDFDRDGYLDVLVTDLTGTALYRGGPEGTFTDVTERAKLPRAAPDGVMAAAWADLDGDGWDDLILNQRVYRNAGGSFEDVTDRCSLRIPPDIAGIVVADYDRDGRLDLYLTRTGPPGNLSWLQGRSNGALGNRLMRNLGDWKFEDATKRSGTRGGYRSSFTAGWLDADGDGWPDLFVPNEFGDAVLLVNNRDGTFRPHTLADRPVDFGTMGLALGDVDNDGRIDIYCANMYSKAGTRVIGNMKPDAYPPAVMEKLRRFVAGSQLHLNKGGLSFEHVGAEKQLASVGWAYGPALADLDGDGFLDVYATAGYISVDRTKPDG